MDSNGDHAILTMAANPGYRVPHTIIQLECFLSSPEDILPLLFREKGGEDGRGRINASHTHLDQGLNEPGLWTERTT